MFRRFGFLLLAPLAVQGEIYTMTLKQAVEQALAQSPDVVMARLDEMKAAQAIKIARDPFVPRLDVGSGLAYTNGYPQSVDGSAPSVVNAKASEFIFNKQQTYIVAQARENARGAGFATAAKKDDIAFRTASLYLDLERAAQLGDIAKKQVDSLAKVSEVAKTRIQEGYELPVEGKRAIVELKRSQQRLEGILADQDFAERSLAVVLGHSASDHVKIAEQDQQQLPPPDSEEAALGVALEANKDLRRLESAMISKGLEIKADKAQRLPRVDLVAQYALFSRFNQIQQYFTRFQNNNEEFGMSFSVPLLPGPGINAQVRQAEADSLKLKSEYNATRNRIQLNVHQAYQDMEKAEMAKEVTQADLDFARESLSVLLTQMSEGRASLRQVEEARIVENEKWLAFYDAQSAAERARLSVLKETGQLLASLR